MITGIALANLPKITIDGTTISHCAQEKTMSSNTKRNDRDEGVRFPADVAGVIKEVEVARQLREHVHHVCSQAAIDPQDHPTEIHQELKQWEANRSRKKALTYRPA
jgi:hypothetical protein